MPCAMLAPNDSHDFDSASMQIWMIFWTASLIRSITILRACATAWPAFVIAVETAWLAWASASRPSAWLALAAR